MSFTFAHAKQPDSPELLAFSAAELAERLSVSERHVWTLHRTGRLGPRPVHLGRATRWPAAEISAWLAAGAPCREKWEVMAERKDGAQ